MRSLSKWILAAAFAVATAGIADAQRQPGGGGRGQGAGQQPLELVLLSNTDLQKELKISDDQMSAMKELAGKAEELTKKRGEMLRGGGGGGNIREAMQELQTATTELAKEAKTAMDKALTDDQKKRLKQINVQRMGMAAFNDDDVKAALKLTDAQTETITKMAREMRTAMTELRTEMGLGGRGGAGGGGAGGGARPDPEKMAEFNKKSAELTEKTMESIAKELSDDQVKAWKELTGEKFDLSKLQPARPMRRDN
jgi:hypothetical protein